MTELKVGLLSIATVLAVVFMSFQVTKNQSGFGDYVTYRTVLDDASGIFAKTPIKIAGIPAGRIKKIELVGNKALVTFEVLKKVKVTKGSYLNVKAVGFLGDKFLEIEVDPNSKELLPDNGMLRASTVSGMEGLMKNSEQLLSDLTELVGSIKKTMVPRNQEPPLTAILREIRDILKDFKGITSDTKELVSSNKESINDIVRNMRDAMEDLSYQLNVNEEDSIMSNFKKLSSSSKDLKDITRDIKSIVADIKAGKGTIGKFLVEEEIADQVKETMASVQKIVGKVDAVHTEMDVFTGYDTESDMVAEFGMRIITSPEKFYTISVINSDIGTKTKSHTETTTDGVLSVEEKLYYKKDTFRFTATMGRKLGNWFVHGGLIETTAGAGVGYDYAPWGWRTSFDLFDSRKNIGMNMRITSEFRLWNVFYGRLRANDMAVSTTRSFSISLGLRFSDDDLRSLLGVML
jgi:phospholipid/cholesterol/gamma-HCH transport system substrate-binding protein